MAVLGSYNAFKASSPVPSLIVEALLGSPVYVDSETQDL